MHLKKPYLKTKKSNYEEKDNNLMEREGFENNEEKEIFNIDDVVKTELNLFPTPVSMYKLPFDYKTTYKFIDEEPLPYVIDRSSDPGPANSTSNSNTFYGAYRGPAGISTEYSSIMNKPELGELSKFILECVVDYNNKKLGYHVNEWKFSQTWTSYKATGQQHITHYHPNSVLSGIFYFSEKQDEISEYYTNLWKYMPPLIFVKYWNNFDEIGQAGVTSMIHVPIREEMRNNEYAIPFEPNKLILFPSWLSHYVPVNDTLLIRKSVSLNIVPTNRLGDPHTMTELLIG